ncbi:hypothetical protein [Luteimonas aquatica]|uniref:hypothetical protein n=1 Tax=Luteimonas aquatica TaxID=450364 RepID=UPI001F560518|nr:hypothetical protein [Luteimonas aquatica]
MNDKQAGLALMLCAMSGWLAACQAQPEPAAPPADPAPPAQSTQARLKTWFPTLQGMYTDARTGEKVLYVLAEDDLRGADDDRKRQAERLLGMPVRLKVLPAPIKEQ